MPNNQQDNKISTINRKTRPLFSGQVQKARAPRLLWANSYCMLDTSSGASISVRQILLQLHRAGWEIEIVGATVFDDPKGTKGLGKSWDAIEQAGEVNLTVNDGPLTHRLIKTHSTVRRKMTVSEADRLYALYVDRLKKFRPDIVFFYGGTSTDFHISHEARVLGIPCAAYLVNANYQSVRWCRDVDLILTDTHATANMYAQKQGFKPKPVGKFIDQGKVIAPAHTRQNATLINPSWAKGAGIVAMLAVLLEKKRPDIQFEVVESRGSWNDIVRGVTRTVWGEERSELSNVIVTPNTDNICEVYARSRIVLGLSQWWESGSRVLAEAMLNGIPAIVTNHGGSPEIVGDGGIVVNLPSACHEAPYNRMPKPEDLHVLAQFLERVWDDEPFYLNLMVRALQQGNQLHQIEVSTRRLLEAFKPLVDQRAGERDFAAIMQAHHKHKLREQILEPNGTMEPKQSLGQTAEIKKYQNGTVQKRITSKHPGLYEREVFWLTKFAGRGVPQIISCSEREKKILMTDVGEPLHEENIPNDWETQLRKILEELKQQKCRHNDLTPEEICVSNGKLSVVDFGWASIGHDFSCGGRAPFSVKERLYVDEDVLDRVHFKFRKDFSGTDFVCCFSWGRDEIIRSKLIKRGAINIQSFQLRGSLLQQVKKRLKGSFLESLDECEAFETGSLSVFVCIFDKATDNSSQYEELCAEYSVVQQCYCSKNLSEAREMIRAVTFFREEYPYVLWRHWWNGAFDKSEIAKAEFQDKRQGISSRWDCISTWMMKNSVQFGAALDIGSNLGDSCIRLSSAGFNVIGVEPDPKVYRESLVRTRGHNVKIFNTEATSNFFSNHTKFDVVLALSVLHRIWALKGRSEAEIVLRMAAEKSNFIVIEGACSLDRFRGKSGDLPSFRHNDISSSTIWHLDWFASILSSDWCFDYLGAVPHTSSEPLRILFGARRTTIVNQPVEQRRTDNA